MQTFLERVRPAPPSAGVVRNDPEERSYHHFLRAKACTPPVTAVCIGSAGRVFRIITCHCLSVRGLYPRTRTSSVLTARNAHTSVAGVPRAITALACVIFTDPSGLSLIVCSL